MSQLASDPRVSLHVPNVATFDGEGWTYRVNVHVWPTYSLATKIDRPVAAAAP